MQVFGVTLREASERAAQAPAENRGQESTASANLPTSQLVQRPAPANPNDEATAATIPDPLEHPPLSPEESDDLSEQFDCAESSDEDDEKGQDADQEFVVEHINFEDVALGIIPRFGGVL